MHRRRSSRLIWVVAFGGLLWLLILFALTAGDYLTRAGGYEEFRRPTVKK